MPKLPSCHPFFAALSEAAVHVQIDPKKLPVKQQGYSAAFDIEFSNSSRVKVTFFICYSVPRRIQTDSGPKYEWDLVTRDHCKNGCPVSSPTIHPLPCQKSLPWMQLYQAAEKASHGAAA